MTEPWQRLKPGEGWRGWWQPDLVQLPALPVLAARGRTHGPTVLLTGAVHGDEFEGTAAIHALFRRLGDELRSGVVIGLPVVNVAAWEARSRVTPEDGMDLNRSFPGSRKAGSTSTQLLAELVFDTFVRASDVLVDLHSGGLRLLHLPMAGWYAGSVEAERLARGFGERFHPWLIPDVAGVLSNQAHRAGKAAIGAEWAGGARLDPVGAEAYASGVRSVLAALAMTEGAENAPDLRTPISGSYQETAVGGLFTPSVSMGERVQAGDRIGVLYDGLGECTGEVVAARSGMVAGLPHLAKLLPGDRVAYIG